MPPGSVPLWSNGKWPIYHCGAASVVAPKALFVSFALLAAATSGGALPSAVQVPTKAVSPALASVRILSGAKVRMGASTQGDGHKRIATEITLEDGRRRPAQLVEFQ